MTSTNKTAQQQMHNRKSKYSKCMLY